MLILNSLPLPRALSQLQEQAQLLTGSHMPEAVLNSLVQSSSAGQKIGLVNLSPYDGWLEKVVLRWEKNYPGQEMSSLSLSGDLNMVKFSEKQCAFSLLEAIISTNLSQFILVLSILFNK